MNDLFIYLLKVSAGLGIIFIPYYFLFRNDPNLHIKRFYLMAGIVASWAFPFITFRKLPLAVDLTPTVFIDLDTPVAQAVTLESTGASPGFTINWLQVVIFIYLAGLSFMFLKNMFLLSKWNLTWLRTRSDEGVAFTKNDQVFTLFTRIFVPGSLKDKDDLDNVLLHERAHIRQLHFIDLMLMEFTLLLTWFNPFSWLISRMIKENHEHLADREVLSTGINPARYRAQLMNHTLGVNVFRLGTQFNHSLTIKRFKMMKKPKRSLSGILKIALLIPAVLITLGLTTGMTPQQKTIKGKVVLAETGEPVPGASIVIRNGTTGCVSDLDGNFRLNVDANPELVISFVGMETLIVKASEVGKKPLELKVKTYNLDLESVPQEVKKDADKSKTITLEADKITIKGTDGSPTNPVYVLDGEIVKSVEDIGPESIVKIDVIKDPEHPLAKKYKAKEGVVLITTKESLELGKEILENESDEPVFYIVEDMPMYPGGMSALKNYIYSNLEYPIKTKSKAIEGEVKVRFLVNEKGKVVNTEILSSTYQGFDAAALKVISDMPDWTPGKQRGKPVKVWYVVPIKFSKKK